MENGMVTLRSSYLESYDAFVDALPAALQQQISAIRDVHAEAYRLIQEAESSTGESGSLHATDSGTLLAADTAQRENAFERIRELDDLLEQRSVFVSKLLELVRGTVTRVDSNYQLFAQYKTVETEHVAAASTRNGRSSASLAQQSVRRRPPLIEGARKREHASVSSVSTSRRAASSKRAALRKGSSIHLASARRGNGHAERSGVAARANRGAKISKTANDAVSKVDNDDDEEEEDEEPDEREVEEPEVHEEVDRRTTARDRRLSNLTRRAVRRPNAANGKRRPRLAEQEAPNDESDQEDAVPPSKKERDLADTSDQDAEDREPDAEGDDEATKRSRRSQSADESDSEEQPAARADDTATRSGSESDNEGASPPRRAEPQASTRRTRNSHVEQPRATSSANAGAKRNSAATRGAAKAKRSTAASGTAAQSFNPAEHFVIEPNEPTYCLCAQVSYGDMIMCDNAACSIEWFHFACVSLKTKPKGKWYCPFCRAEPNRSNVMRKRPTDKKS